MAGSSFNIRDCVLPILNVATRFISEMLNAPIENVQQLAIIQNLCSTKGEIKFNYSAVFCVNSESGRSYVHCDAFSPCSTRDITQTEAYAMVSKAIKQSEGFKGKSHICPNELWLSRETFIELGLEMNPFTTFVLKMSESGEFEGLEFESGDLVYCSPHQHKNASNLLKNSSHIMVVNSFIPETKPLNAWCFNSLNKSWRKK